MIFALPLYLLMEGIKRLRARSGDLNARQELASASPVTAKMLCSLGVPAAFDLSSVLLLMAGLMHIPASMWSLLRGGCTFIHAYIHTYVRTYVLWSFLRSGCMPLTLPQALAPTLLRVGCIFVALMRQFGRKPSPGSVAVSVHLHSSHITLTLSQVHRFRRTHEAVRSELAAQRQYVGGRGRDQHRRLLGRLLIDDPRRGDRWRCWRRAC